MLEAIRTFVFSFWPASVRMIYFAGHGAQYEGNYLIQSTRNSNRKMTYRRERSTQLIC